MWGWIDAYIKMDEKDSKYTKVGTDIEAIKEQARQSGLSYNEAIEWIARKTGGHGTHVYSDTNTEVVKEQIRQSEQVKQKQNKFD